MKIWKIKRERRKSESPNYDCISFVQTYLFALARSYELVLTALPFSFLICIFRFFIVMEDFVSLQKRLLRVRQRAKIKAITFDYSYSSNANDQFRQKNIGMSDEKRPSKVLDSFLDRKNH